MDQTPNTFTTPAPTPIGQPAQSTPPQPTNTFAVIAVVFGGLAFLSGTSIFGALFGITAIIMAAIVLKKKAGGKNLAIAALISGTVGLISGIIFTVLILTGVFTGGVSPFSTSSSETKKDELSISAKRSLALIESKKNFEKGETARFGYIDVKVNSASGDYQKDSRLEANRTYYSVNVTLTNTDIDSQRIAGDLRLKVDGTVYGQSNIGTDITAESIQPGQSVTGTIFFEVKENGKKFTLQYTKEDVFNPNDDSRARLVWTLAL